jgi:hypothetical protein
MEQMIATRPLPYNTMIESRRQKDISKRQGRAD